MACRRANNSSVLSVWSSRSPALARPSTRMTAGNIKPWPTSVTRITENVRKKNQIAVGEWPTVIHCEWNGKRRGKRHDTADAGESEHEWPLPRWRGVLARYRREEPARQIRCRENPYKSGQDHDNTDNGSRASQHGQRIGA